MAETGGELVVFIILGVIFIGVILIVFSYVLIFGFTMSSSSLCYTSSMIRNFFFQDLCIPSSNPIIHNFFCLSYTLANSGIEPPLIGCSTGIASYTSIYPQTYTFSQMSGAIASCFYKYGGYQNLSVLPDGPALCDVISVYTGKNFSFYNFTKFMQSETYTSQVNCINYTPQEACPNYQEGYVCDKDSPSLCERANSNYFTCLTQQGYSPIYPGYYLQSIPLNGSGFTAANNASSYLCDSTQGCYFNTTLAECTKPGGSAQFCTQLYTNFCKNTTTGWNCTMDYDPTTKSLVPPPSCIETEPAKSTAIQNISFMDYFMPGINLFFSFKNISTGKPGEVVSAYNKTLDLQNATFYIVYLNTMTRTRFPPKVITLPPECAPLSWYNNYPANCFDYCARAVAVYGSILGSAGASDPGILTLGAAASAGAASYGYHYCSQSQLCSTVLPSAYNTISTLAFTTSGLGDCISCVSTSLKTAVQQAGAYLSLDRLNFLGRNIVFVCAVTK